MATTDQGTGPRCSQCGYVLVPSLSGPVCLACEQGHEHRQLPLVRATDPPPSREAAAVVRPMLTHLQQAVYEAFGEHGPASAREAERWTEMQAYGFSTVRKRVSELAEKGVLIRDGIERRSGRTSATVYRVAR